MYTVQLINEIHRTSKTVGKNLIIRNSGWSGYLMIIIRAAKLNVSPARSKKPTFRRDCIFSGNFTFWPYTRPNFEVANFVTSSIPILALNGFAELILTGRFEFSPDITSLASSKSSTVATFLVWGSFSSSFLLPWLWRLNMTVLLTPLDGKLASKSHWTVWYKHLSNWLGEIRDVEALFYTFLQFFTFF